jgi:hypothetical protein
MSEWTYRAAVDAFERNASPALADAEARERLAGIPDAFGRSIVWWLAERHLTSERIDVAMSFERGRSAANLIATVTAQPALWATWPDASSVVRAWTDPGDDLHAATQISFEVDRAGDAKAIPFPFVSMEPTAGASVPRERAERLTAGFLRACGAADALAPAHRVLADLPGWCRPIHLGWLNARGLRRQRWVLAVPKPRLAEFLTAVRWPGDPRPVAALAVELGTWTHWISVHLDVEHSVQGRIGLGWFHPGKPTTDPRWAPLFRWLHERGLAGPAALAAVGDWPGEGPGVRRLLEVKVAWDEAGSAVAKAYCALRATGAAL